MRAPSVHVEPIELAPQALLNLAARWPGRYPVLLDSAADGALAQMSLLAALPRGCLWLDSGGGIHTTGDLPPLEANAFLPALEAHWRSAAQGAAGRPATLPFGGGWFVYLGYELGLEIEPSLRPFWPQSSFGDARPVAAALRIPAALMRGSDGRGQLITEPTVTPEERQQILADLQQVAALPVDVVGHPAIAATEEDPAAYLQRIHRTQEYIRAGDIYQANLSRPWRARLPEGYPAAALYQRLRTSNPAPFAAFAQFGALQILSSSP
ncbi:MAG: chorismate-binding protein, partial [Pseudomonadota bacterium]